MNESPDSVPAVHGDIESGEVEAPFEGVTRITSHSERSTVTGYAFEAGAEFPIHAHAEEQITVVLEGSVEFEVRGEPQRLGSGETFVVASDLEHGLRAGPDGARFLAIVVPKRRSADSYRLLGDQDA